MKLLDMKVASSIFFILRMSFSEAGPSRDCLFMFFWGGSLDFHEL